MTMMQRTFRSWRGRHWSWWRALADRRDRLAGTGAMAVVFSAASVAENAAIGSVVAALTVSNLPEGVTVVSWAITADPDTKFAIAVANLTTAALLDYEAKTTHSVTVEATLSDASTVSGTKVISVTNVYEQPELAALTLTPNDIISGSVGGTLVGAIGGKTANSTLSLTDTAGGRFALDGTNIETGATATDYDVSTSHNITVRETLADSPNSPRDSIIEITVTEEGAAEFDPLTLTPTAWYDPSDLSTLFQDAAMTTPVTADGDVVGAMMDKSGNGRHLLQATTASKPLYKTSGGLHWLQGDGVNDLIRADFTLVQPFDRISALHQITWTTGRRIFAGGTAANAGILYQQSGSTAPNLQMYSGSGLNLSDEVALGTNFVVTERFNEASSRAAINANAYVTGAVGASNPGGLTLFAEPNGVTPGNVRCYGAFVRAGGTLSDAEITSLRSYYAGKSGAAEFDPLTLTPAAWYDPSDLSTLFQDAAMTTPVTADGDVVGAVMDKSGNGLHLTQATGANKPLYKTNGTLHWLQFDGVNDTLGVAMAGAAGTSVFIPMLTSDTSWATIYDKNNIGAHWAGIATSGSGSSPTGGSVGTPTYHANNGAALTSTRSALHTAWSLGSAVVAEIRDVDPSTSSFDVGAYGAIPFQGNFYEIFLVPEVNLDTTSRAALYTWLGTKSGVTL